MVRELEKIFGLDAIALHLCVAGERLVFLQELGGIAARAIVLAVAGVRAWFGERGPAAAAAPAATLTIVDQM